MDDSGDQDMYVSQLKEVFDSCDAGGIGMLNREELVELCSKLQLEDQADELLRHLLGDSTQTLVCVSQRLSFTLPEIFCKLSIFECGKRLLARIFHLLYACVMNSKFS